MQLKSKGEGYAVGNGNEQVDHWLVTVDGGDVRTKLLHICRHA
jgi:hypothetical protein